MSKQFYFKQFSLAWIRSLQVKIVLFQTIQFSISTQFSSIWPTDKALSGATTPGQSGNPKKSTRICYRYLPRIPLPKQLGRSWLHNSSDAGTAHRIFLDDKRLNVLQMAKSMGISSGLVHIFNWDIWDEQAVCNRCCKKADTRVQAETGWHFLDSPDSLPD